MADPIQPDTLEDGAGDFNVDPEDTLTLEESQSVNEYEPEETGTAMEDPPVELDAVDTPSEGDDPGAPNAKLTTSKGVGANDNNPLTGIFNTANNANAAGNAAATGKITPQPNVLDRFATYTYQASVYMMSTEQLETYNKTGKRNVQGYNLLFQSGGAPNNIGGAQGGDGTTPNARSADAGRNPFFPLDYYIEAITLNNSLFGKSTNAAHSVVDMKFTVVEPTGITLIDNLYKAAQDIAPRTSAGSINYAACVYLMVIRFYGQDINGNIQRVGAADSISGLSDNNALVEKFIPFRIKEIKFSIANRLVSYEFETAPIGQMIGASTRRGTIPADIELSATTVGKMLSGEAQYSGATTTSANPGASTTSNADGTTDGRTSAASPTLDSTVAPSTANNAPNNKKTIKQGLIAAMNDLQKELVQKKIYNVADEYVLEFANGAEAIRDGKIAKSDKKVNKSATAMPQAPSQNTQSASPDKTSLDVTSRNWGVTAGMQLVQAIDMVIRNSSYITDQAVVTIDEETGKPVPNPKAGTKGMKWFNIVMEATQLGYDEKRNDFAYRVKYIITPYTLTDFNSPYFPIGNFRGVHKKYPYWFTGENTQVLDYQATFNKLYSLTMTGPEGSSGLSAVRKKYTSSMRDIAFYQYQARSTESAQGAEGKANELAASAAEYLYNPSDNANAKVRIIGDPAWIQQGSVTNSINALKMPMGPFLPDGTINFDVNDVMFEISWQKPQDYNLNTGLADPYANPSRSFGNDRSPVQSVIYRAKSVQSEFRQGRFEQTLEGTLYNYPVPSGANKASTASNTNANTSTTTGDADGASGADASDNSDTVREDLANQTIETGDRTSGDQYQGGDTPVETGYDDFSQSAEFENYGSPGPTPATEFNSVELGYDSGEYQYPEPSPADTVWPADPSGGVESNGEIVDTGSEQSVPFSGRITEAQRAEINQSTQNNISGFDIEINPTPSNPQLISRDW